MFKQLTDQSLLTGVYEGDLRYGRRAGDMLEKGRDHPANRVAGKATNKPVEPLKLVEQRDVALWTKDPRLKEAKKSVVNSFHFVGHMLHVYRENSQWLKANIHITVGRQRM